MVQVGVHKGLTHDVEVAAKGARRGKSFLLLWMGAKARTLIVTEPVGSPSHRHKELMNSAALHLGTLEAEVGLIKGNAETQSGERVSWIWAKLISSCRC